MTKTDADTTETPPPWNQSLLLAAASVGGALIVAGLVTVVVLLNLPVVSGLELLPANRTIIALAGDDAALRRMLQEAAPGLPTLPASGSGRVIALITVAPGQEEWISLPRQNVNLDDPTLTLSPAARAVLEEGPSLLAEALPSALPADAEMVFFATVPWLRANSTLHPFLTAALTGRSEVAIARQGNRWQLSVNGGPARDTLNRALPLSLNDPIFALAAADLPTLLATLQSWQQPDARLITAGLVRALIGRTLGPESLSGATLAALQNAVSLAVAADAAGTPRFAAALPAADASALAESFAAAFEASLPRASIVHQPLDEEYTLNDVRLDPAAIVRTESQINGRPTVTLSRSGSVRTLSLAPSPLENRLLIGSDPESVAAPMSQLPLLSTNGALIAAGVVRPAALGTWLPPSTAILLSRGLLRTLPDVPVIPWNLTARNGVWSLFVDLPL